MTFGAAAAVYLRKVRANVSLKPRSKDYRDMVIDYLRRSWPSLFQTDVRKVSQRDCEEWLGRYQQQYAGSIINNSIGTLRATEPANATIMPAFECQNSMTHAAAKIGMKRITHHDLRHLFATIAASKAA